ncbi:MAG: hypothetical protein JXA79_07370 [Deltaproteobacteria bacterium]|nr:hypothetical protein [Deltaproteobacteria bacterium]
MKKLLVLLAAGAFVLGLTLPAMSADWSFYGSSRMSTFFDSDSEEVNPALGGNDDDDLTWSLQGNSRIGANVKAGNIGGRFEYGSGPNLRLLYGTWNFGAGELLVGQSYTPWNYFISNQVYAGDQDLLPTGGMYDGRRPMIQLSSHGFKLALVQPNTATLAGYGQVDTDTSIPKIEVSYAFNAGPAKLTLFGLYNTFDAVTATNDEEGVDSHAFGFGFMMPFGAAYLNGNIWMGQNIGASGIWNFGADDPQWDGTDVVDNDTTGYALVAGFKMSDAISFELGYGATMSELDVSGADEDEAQAMYAQATINIAKGFTVTPEIGKIDYKEDAAGNDQGDTTYFGAKWQINF